MSSLYKYLKETIILQDINQKIRPSLEELQSYIDDYCNSEDRELLGLSLESMINPLNKIIDEFNNLGYTYEPEFSPDVSEKVFKQNLMNYKEQIDSFINNFTEDKIESFNVQTKYILNLIESHMDSNNLNESSMITLEESIEVHDNLNPKLWNTDMTLKEEVLIKLKEISDEFINYIEIPLNIVDIEIVGSNASFNYNSKSDIDLHIIVNFALSYVEPAILQQLYNSKKNSFNSNYDLTIKGLPVELYIEDIMSGNATNGRYSILKQEWIKIPTPINYDIPDISKELSEYEEKCDKALKSNDAEEVQDLINEIYMMRKLGLAEEGEASIGNLVFKELRNEDYLNKLRERYYELRSEDLSIE